MALNSLTVRALYTGCTLFFFAAMHLMPLKQAQAQVSVKIVSSEGNDFDYFGEAVSIDGDYAVVGSWLDDNSNGKDAGSVRIYKRAGAAWEEEQELIASDGEAGDQFGYSVSINEEFVFVGAHRDDNDNGPFAGSVYIFERTDAGWVEQARIIATDGALDDRFGATVSSRGSRLIIGATGADLGAGSAYVYHRVQNTWQFVNKIQASNGMAGDQFGASVAIEAEYAVVGAKNHNNEGLADAGAAYTFVFNGTEWVEQAMLASPDPLAGASFGHAVSMTGNFAFIGAPGQDVLGNQEIGVVDVFVRNGVTWSWLQSLTAFDGASGDEFGFSVVAEGEYAVFGARWHRNNQGAKSGAAYLFLYNGTDWQSEAKLLSVDGAVGDQFGSAIDFNNEQVIVGARWDDNEIGQDAGAAYIFPVGNAGVPSLLASFSRLDYGAESVGEDTDQVVTLSNSGTADLSITDVRIEGPGAEHFRLVQGGNNVTLAPLASIDLTVEFRPISPGGKEASLLIVSNSPSSPEIIALEGEGIEGLQPGIVQVIASRGDVALSFGSTVAVSDDYVIVGAEGQQDDEPGAAYIYQRIGDEWVQQSLLTALDGQPGDRFGSAVAISNTHAIVGAWNSETATGSAYIFIRSGSVWIQQAKLTAMDGSAGDHFGRSVSIDGEFAVVGAWQNDNTRGAAAGAVYVYRLDGNAWNQQVKLLASDGQQGDRFGSAVAIKGDRIIAGAANGGFFGEGRAYVFSWQDPIWAPDGQLLPDGASLSDGFGSTVTIEGNIAVIGAPLYDRSSSIDEGAAYVFEQANNGDWVLRSKLEADGGASGFEFGASVDVQGNEVIIGAPGADNQRGAVYVFLRSGNTWAFQNKISPEEGQDGEEFGRALGYAGVDLIIGAPDHSNVNGADAGIVYLYSRILNNWNFETTVLASNKIVQPLFGASVAISDSIAVIGAEGKETDAGAAFVFERTDAGWRQVAELSASDGENGDLFGRSVDLTDGIIVVGAPGDDNENGTDAGAAYLFLEGTMGWSEQARLIASDGADNDNFAHAVTIDGLTVAVGSPQSDPVAGEDAGKVYVFTANGALWNEQVILTAAEGFEGDNMGTSVALENTTLAVGTPQSNTRSGAVYVYEEIGSTWVQEAQLSGSDSQAGDAFGTDVGLQDNYIIAGAPLHNGDAGAAYVFRRTSGQWGDDEEGKIESADRTSGNRFGEAVALSGSFALVGAPYGNGEFGIAYLFEKDGITWLQQSRLTPQGETGVGFYGNDVALTGDNALIGSVLDSNGNGEEAGSVYFLSISGPVFVVATEDEVALPAGVSLGQNYPNPARSRTTIPFSLPESGAVRLTIYDMIGRRVVVVVDDVHTAGTYEVELNTERLPSGLYMYRIETPSGHKVRSMTVVR